MLALWHEHGKVQDWLVLACLLSYLMCQSRLQAKIVVWRICSIHAHVQISDTVYPMYKAFIEPDLKKAQLRIYNTFNPFSGFMNATYILKSAQRVTFDSIRDVLPVATRPCMLNLTCSQHATLILKGNQALPLSSPYRNVSWREMMGQLRKSADPCLHAIYITAALPHLNLSHS